MSKRSASEEPKERLSKIVKHRTNEQEDGDDENDKITRDHDTLDDDASSADIPQQIEIKPMHQNCPLYFTSDDRVVLDLHSPNAERAQKLLFAIAELVQRREHTHEYMLTVDSLHAALFTDLKTENIIEDLKQFSKTNVPSGTIDHIQLCVQRYGKVKLVLQHNRYFVEGDVCHLLRDSEIEKCRLIATGNGLEQLTTDSSSIIHDDSESVPFEVIPEKIDMLRKRCQQLNYPLLEEYDFSHCTALRNLNIQLSSHANLRPYQEESLQKMFHNGRARSGLIVLPCGAGKSLVGVAATCRLNKSCLVLCNSSVSVSQWKEQFEKWSTADDSLLRLFTSKKRQKPHDSCIYLSTYQMMAFAGGCNAKTSEIRKLIAKQEWGLILLDEVHMAPADQFRKILRTVRAHIKLGLTATLVREDNKIIDLDFLIGPKLYEADWIELQNMAFIAKVNCAEIRCPMTSAFLREYTAATNNTIKRKLSAFNPNKFRMCQFLIKYHEQRNDKIIIYCDEPFAVSGYAHKLVVPLIHGKVSHAERVRIFENFQHNPKIRTIFISRVGDTSLNLPEANVIIQISSHGGSRRQEAQRLGRILRAKKDSSENNAFFYTLVSEETDEMRYLDKRQRFLIDQGYSYKVMTHKEIMDNEENLFYSTQEEQQQLLDQVLKEELPASGQSDNEETKKSSSKSKQTASNTFRHPLFRNFYKRSH